MHKERNFSVHRRSFKEYDNHTKMASSVDEVYSVIGNLVYNNWFRVDPAPSEKFYYTGVPYDWILPMRMACPTLTTKAPLTERLLE